MSSPPENLLVQARSEQAETRAPVAQSAPEEMGTFTADPGDGPLYRPAPRERQLTFRAVLVGCCLGGVVAAMNIYFGLQTGWSMGGSLIAAILGYSVFATLKPRKAFTPLETNIAQTSGSAAGAMASAAGLLSAVPAMTMLGHKFSYLELTLWAGSVAGLGVFYAIPLRRQMVLVEKLRFPSGTATAQTITAMYSSGSDAVRKSSLLVKTAVLAGLFTLIGFFVPQSQHVPLHDWLQVGFLAVAFKYGFELYLGPMMLGAGILIGLRTGLSLALGAIVGWAVLAPMVTAQGWVVGDPMSYSNGARGWILWPGVALMVSDALTNLALSWRSVLEAMRPKRGSKPVEDTSSASEQVPGSWFWVGLLGASSLTVVAGYYVFGIAPWLTVLAVMISGLLAAIATRCTGECDINPVGGMGKVTQLVYGGLAPGQVGANLMCAAVTGAGASQAGDMMHDLKTGWLLGGSPRKQIAAQLWGVMAGVLVCVPIYLLFERAFEIGGDKLPAPAAHAWKAMAEVLSKGLGAMPDHSLPAVAVALAVGAMIPLLRHFFKGARPYLPSGMAIGIAFIVQPFFSLTMCAGALLYSAWQRRNAVAATALGFSLASGLIAGEGLTGVLTALLKLMGFGPLT